MSIHPSLAPTKGKKQRSVLKRYERVEQLKKDGKWEESKSAFGLPKSKVIKIKLKKVKAKDEKAEEGKAGEKDASAKTASK